MAKQNINSNILKADSVLNFGKYKSKTISYVIKHDPNYLHWLIDNNIQNIKLSKDIKMPVKINQKKSYYNNNSSAYDYLDREYARQRRDEYPQTRWGEDGDYYPNGCDIYGFG